MTKRSALTGVIIVFALSAFVTASKLIQEKKLGRVTQGTALGVNKLKGNKKASIRLVIYSDFQCPACSYGSKVADSILTDLKDKVSVEYKYFPLASHKWAWEAAAFAECAADQGKFWQYHDLLFKRQAEWAKEGSPIAYFANFAKELKLDVEKIGKCVVDEKVLQRIKSDRDSGVQLQVSSTPTIFINDKRFVGGKQLDADGKKYIAEELKKIGMDWKYTSTPLPPPPANAQIPSNPSIVHEGHPHAAPVSVQPAVNISSSAAVESKGAASIPGVPQKNLDVSGSVAKSTAKLTAEETQR